MATKKTVNTEGLEQEVEAQQLTEDKYVHILTPSELEDEWEKTIDMIVPRKPKGEDQQYYICVNDRRYMVPANGKMQKLPKPVALILQDSLEMESEADEYADKLPKRDAINPGTII